MKISRLGTKDQHWSQFIINSKNNKTLTTLNGISELNYDEKRSYWGCRIFIFKVFWWTLSEHIRSTDIAYITARNGLRSLDPCHKQTFKTN